MTGIYKDMTIVIVFIMYLCYVLLLKQQQKCTQDCKQVFSAEQLYHLVLKFTHPETLTYFL